jgi:hypothetical protein
MTDKETVKLDFDDTPLDIVKYWAFRTMKWFKLQGFAIFRSSKKSHHVIFNCKVTWKKNMHIMSWVAVESQNPKLKDYVLMQGIKESSTLRVSPKNEKSSPRAVCRYGKQDGQIKGFMNFRRMIKRLMKRYNDDPFSRGNVDIILS